MYRSQDTAVRELDRRIGDGIDVSLLWNSRTSDVTVAVTDTRHGASVEFGVKAGEAREAFWHPYAYLAQRGRDVPADTGLSGPVAERSSK